MVVQTFSDEAILLTICVLADSWLPKIVVVIVRNILLMDLILNERDLLVLDAAKRIL